MNAREMLLAEFHRLAEVPDAVPRLRRFVLDLAVRGRLVEQDPSEKVDASLGPMLDAGTLVRSDSTPGWVTGKCAQLLAMEYGKALPPEERVESNGVPVYGSNGVIGYSRSPLTAKPAIIVGRKGSAGALNLADGPSWTTDVAYFVVAPPHFDVRYLRLAMETLDLGGLARGVKPGLSRADAYALGLDVPPLAEQRRIVAKVDELMALCDRLEAAQREREGGRDRLVVARLHDLHETDAPSITRSRVDLLLTEMPRTTSKPQDMAHLRQAVTTLALRGRLSTQDPCDESALSFLAQLRKQVATARGERGTEVPEDMAVPPEDCPHALPSGWAWARLAALFTSITDGDHQPPPRAEEGVAFLTIGNISSGGLDFGDCRIVSRSYYESLAPHRRPALGDILYTVVGATYGRPVLVDAERPFCVQRHIAILKPARGVNRSYLMRVLSSAAFYDQATRSITGAAQPTIPLRPLRRLLVPVPPLAEQRRIVARLDELISLCDRLEGQLALGQAEGTRLLRSVIQEALAEAS